MLGLSLPAWERGLKCIIINLIIRVWYVAPCAGAWVEIIHLFLLQKSFPRRSLRGSVDWNIKICLFAVKRIWSLPASERGLKFISPCALIRLLCRSQRESMGWNSCPKTPQLAYPCRSQRGSESWNSTYFPFSFFILKLPAARKREWKFIYPSKKRKTEMFSIWESPWYESHLCSLPESHRKSHTILSNFSQAQWLSFAKNITPYLCQ